MPWIPAILVAVIAWAFLGTGGFVLGFAVGAIAGKLWLMFSSRNLKPTIGRGTVEARPAHTESPPLKHVVGGCGATPPLLPRTRISSAANTRRKPTLEWHPPGSSISVAGIPLPTGMIYCCSSSLPYPGEPSAISTSLSVSNVADNPSDDFGYYPNYENLNAGQRRTYLEWLANGRTDANPSIRSLGYLFLFFYGLERRVILEKDTSPAIVEEILRLLSVYAPVTKSRSLRRYFLQLAHFSAWQSGAEQYRAMWPRLIEFEGDRPSEDSLRFIFANLHQRNETLDWTMAYRVALINEECRKSVVVTRAREQFWELFQKRYQEMFPAGFTLQAAKQMSTEQYTPASSALLYGTVKKSDSTLRIPNVIGVHRQFEFLPTLWNSCIDDLSGFSRILSSKRDDAALKAWQSLPEELRKPETHPLRADLEAILATAPQEAGYYFLQTGALAGLLGIGERSKLSSAQSRDVSEFVEGLGYSLAPDARHTGVSLAWNQELALFVSPEKPTEQLPGLMSLLFLSMALAAADGFVETEELARFNTLVEPEIASAATWSHLKATEEALRRDGNIATRSLAQVAKRIPSARREFVLRAMIHIAAADGEVGLDELKALRKIARAFELDESLPDRLIREDDAFGEVTVERKSGGDQVGEAIPQKAKAAAFALDTERIKALTAETHEVISLLSEVMVDEHEEPVIAPSRPMPAQSEAMPEWVQGLDARYQQAFLEVIRHDTLTAEAFDGVANKYHLMPDDLVNAINAWSDESLGDFLLERDEDVRIFRSLLPETESLQPA